MSGWNRSNNNNCNGNVVDEHRSKTLNGFWIVAAVVCVAVLLMFAVMRMRPKLGAKESTAREEKTIAQVNPPVHQQTASVQKPLQKLRMRSNEGAKTYVDEKGVKRYEGGARVFDGPRRTPVKLSNEKPLFHNYAENQIAALLMTQPGDTVFVTRKFDKRFVDAFEKSLKEPILIDDEDSERDKELKRTMNEVKADLAQRVRNGEDVCVIMEETYSELNRLAQVKRDITKMARDMLKDAPEMTAEQASDLVKAANKMLEDKGCAPISRSSLLGKHFRFNFKTSKKFAN